MTIFSFSVCSREDRAAETRCALWRGKVTGHVEGWEITGGGSVLLG